SGKQTEAGSREEREVTEEHRDERALQRTKGQRAEPEAATAGSPREGLDERASVHVTPWHCPPWAGS
ncbi:MAG TPA: hypothetical protein PKL73_21180, partial [Polyangiaceae bacterium]|nr:hypothetical protein [Polyangiaceae bacterium]